VEELSAKVRDLTGFGTLASVGSVLYGGAVVGQVLGNGLGYRFSSPVRGPVSICLAVDASISVSSSYPTYGFGVLCNDGNVHATTIAATYNAGQVCGSVTANGNYYPVKTGTVSGTDTCTVVQPGQSSASGSGGGPNAASASAYLSRGALFVAFLLCLLL